MPDFSPVYIVSASAVSPQASFEQMMHQPENYSGDRLQCVEPDYTRYVDAKLIRRMSRIIKMGVAAASEALSQAALTMPDAIITGTAYGCLSDTDQFLTRMVEFKETLLSPTAFIQSTHNTVAAQIALLLQCHHYNNTYVHRGASFESALTDAVSLLQADEAKNVLVGAADEITEKSHQILKRFGLYQDQGESLSLMALDRRGTMAGEGASFFVLSTQYTSAGAQLTGFQNHFRSTVPAAQWVADFLTGHQTAASEIDLVLLGNNGDPREDGHYHTLSATVFSGLPTATYKQYCGEYPTSIGFALWMATHIISAGAYQNRPVKKILIYNNYMLQYPAVYLLSAC